MKKSSNVFNLAFFLFFISALCASLVSGVHGMTAPIIAKMEAETLKASYAEVYPGFDSFKQVENQQTVESIKDILIVEKKGQPVGVIYKVVSQGYSGSIDILLAFDIASQKLTGVKILKQTETPGLGANAEKPKFTEQFIQKNAKEELTVVKEKAKGASEIEAITASTITSKAVVLGINTAREHFVANYMKGS